MSQQILLLDERHRLIRERQAAKGRGLATDLARDLGTSEDTIRRDLRELASPLTLSPGVGWKSPRTRLRTSALAGHFPLEHAVAFRVLAASQGKDLQELLAEAINMAFKRYRLPNCIEITSGRRTRRARKSCLCNLVVQI